MHFLIVEQDEESARQLSSGLRRLGHQTQTVDDGCKALENHTCVDFVLLDLNLSDVDGIEVCRAIRAEGETPIITMSTRNSELDRVLGLQAGADDYVVKPYGFRELLARIEAIARRVWPRRSRSRLINRETLSIDCGAHEVRVADRRVGVTRKEFDLLRMLATEPETVFSRRQIMSTVWHDDVATSSRTIDTHVSSLRRKLGSTSWVVTIRGVGFRFGGPGSTRSASVPVSG